MYLWRAIDQNGEAFDILFQARRDKRAALKLMRRFLKKHGFAPRTIVTDKWRAYAAGRPPLSGPVSMLVHDRPGCHRHDGFWGWRAVAQSTVRSLGVVVFPPVFDDDLRLFQGVEDFAV